MVFKCKYFLKGVIFRKFTTQAHFNMHLFLEGDSKQIQRLKGLPIIHHHGYVCELPPDHRFPMRKFHTVFEHLVNDGVIAKEKQVVTPCQVMRDLACSVHTEEYVDKFFNGKISKDDQRVTGFKWTPGLVSRVRYETGGTLVTAYLALERGLACSTAGGTHHAFPDHGSGYCLINDIAIAAQYMINCRLVKKILIVDLDVHQGNGTAFIFKNSNQVFTFSMHCGGNFPFKKEESDLDVAFEPGTGDAEYMSSLIDHLPMLFDTFRPDLVLYDAGVDPHEDDELGKLNLTDKGLLERDLYVIRSSLSRGIPCAAVIGGGYLKDVELLGKRHTTVHRAASKVWEQKEL